MCNFYVYSYPCGHNATVFASYCKSAHMIQRACRAGNVAATLPMEVKCEPCKAVEDLEKLEKRAPRDRKGARKGGWKGERKEDRRLR